MMFQIVLVLEICPCPDEHYKHCQMQYSHCNVYSNSKLIYQFRNKSHPCWWHLNCTSLSTVLPKHLAISTFGITFFSQLSMPRTNCFSALMRHSLLAPLLIRKLQLSLPYPLGSLYSQLVLLGSSLSRLVAGCSRLRREARGIPLAIFFVYARISEALSASVRLWLCAVLTRSVVSEESLLIGDDGLHCQYLALYDDGFRPKFCLQVHVKIPEELDAQFRWVQWTIWRSTQMW